jgi:hypothetical protein
MRLLSKPLTAYIEANPGSEIFAVLKVSQNDIDGPSANANLKLASSFKNLI